MPKSERGILHCYNAVHQRWSKSRTELIIDETPFSEGVFRAAYRATMTYDGQTQEFVCKFAKDINTPRTMYFNDVEAQEYSSMYARKFNDSLCSSTNTSTNNNNSNNSGNINNNNVSKICFVPAFVLELVDRPGRPLCGLEKKIDGEFRKHNNNVGAVCTPVTEDHKKHIQIAQAFSHFSFHASNHSVLVCDIQGVNLTFTDPQVHTVNGKGFGAGNLGMTGIRAFLLRHNCNEYCTLCAIPTINAKNLEATLNQLSAAAATGSTANRSRSPAPARVFINDSTSTTSSSSTAASFSSSSSSSAAFTTNLSPPGHSLSHSRSASALIALKKNDSGDSADAANKSTAAESKSATPSTKARLSSSSSFSVLPPRSDSINNTNVVSASALSSSFTNSQRSPSPHENSTATQARRFTQPSACSTSASAAAFSASGNAGRISRPTSAVLDSADEDLMKSILGE